MEMNIFITQITVSLCKSIFSCLQYLVTISFLPLSEYHTHAAAKSLQSCPTLCNPTDSSPPGSGVPGILQVRTLEWVAISFSNAWKWKVKVKSLSHVWLFTTPWTTAHQVPPSMGFSRQEYWSGVPSPSPTITHIGSYNIIFCDLLPSISLSSFQSLSCVRLFATPWTAAFLFITNSRSLIKLIKLVMPSNHLILCHPLLLSSIFPSIRVFSNESVLRIRWPKYWSFSFSINPSNEYSGLT